MGFTARAQEAGACHIQLSTFSDQNQSSRGSGYFVEQIFLGGRITINSTAYRRYHCSPSEQFPLIDGMMKVARLAAAAQCANAPEGTAPSAQVHAEGFEQALRVLRAACPLPFEKVPPLNGVLSENFIRLSASRCAAAASIIRLA
jgi:hypothetical protein